MLLLKIICVLFKQFVGAFKPNDLRGLMLIVHSNCI